MPLPFLAFLGLGLGGKSLLDKMQEKQLQESFSKANGIFGDPGQEMAGPIQPGMGPLMSRGTGLMGGELTPTQAGSQLLPLGGPWTDVGEKLIENWNKPPTSKNLQTITVGVPDKPGYVIDKQLLPSGRAIDIPGAIPRKSGSNVSVNNYMGEGGYRVLTPEENKATHTPPGTVQDKNGQLHAPPTSRVTAEEAKQLSQGNMAMQMMADIEENMKNNPNFDPSDPITWAKSYGSSIPILSHYIDITPEEANTKSNIEQLGNLVLAMVRGAQVGPAEQEKFEKQLPQYGQNKELFNQNLINTKRNIKTMMSRMSKLRDYTIPNGGQETSTIYETWTDEDGIVWERTGTDPNSPNSWRKKQ